MGSRKQTQGTDVQLLILTTARQLFLRHGASRISLSDIAKQADISKGTLYYYYSSKSDLIFDITQEHMSSITQSLLDWVAGLEGNLDPCTVLTHVYKTISSATARNRLHLYLLHEAITDNPELRKRFRQSYKTWHGMLTDGLIKILPQTNTIEPAMLASLFLTSITGCITQHSLGISNLPYKEMSGLLLAAAGQQSPDPA